MVALCQECHGTGERATYYDDGNLQFLGKCECCDGSGKDQEYISCPTCRGSNYCPKCSGEGCSPYGVAANGPCYVNGNGCPMCGGNKEIRKV